MNTQSIIGMSKGHYRSIVVGARSELDRARNALDGRFADGQNEQQRRALALAALRRARESIVALERVTIAACKGSGDPE